LLFIHGIFSSCESGFSSLALDQATMAALHTKYDGRIIGFDHPTATVTPAENAAALLAQIPDGVTLDLDIVTHSRGGLVARELAATRSSRLTIHRIVFAATPNGGSEITDTKNFARLVGRITSLLTFPAAALTGPVGEVTEILAALLELVKIIGIGAAIELPGLESMLPTGAYLPELTARETAAYGAGSRPTAYAAAASFSPGELLATVFHKLDDLGRIVDEAVFPGVANDIAVPTTGVWDPAGTGADAPGAASLFPIPTSRRLALGPGDVCWHCNYFGQAATRAAVLTWLTT
jgi:pimeloyl-ACP methyl ester carboxylesterase